MVSTGTSDADLNKLIAIMAISDALQFTLHRRRQRLLWAHFC
ncbi:hypothetical protein WDV93_02005 [Pantoea ananatis]